MVEINASNLTEAMNKSKLYGYLTMYKGNKYEVWTDKGTYEAQKIAQAYFKCKKGYDISVNLCVKPENEQVLTIATY